ncbi:MAG: response regulator [Myxococcaceae bacterium]|nr:response regulator [Myxococcaceae bacterium]
MTRVLFVDDERMLLNALKCMLRGIRREWHMVFVDSGEAALSELGKNAYDVIVTDMRMPQMDGAELLRRVAEQWPDTGRVLLSGYTDEDARERVANVAHACLDKPCPATELCAAIEQQAA